ncbi:MAG: FliH/SctL family protein [Actinomycetota bacterium]|jgi:flagellar assembly protein FliH|nr:FliH/SctL family protein [Actinomycetota bacterium]
MSSSTEWRRRNVLRRPAYRQFAVPTLAPAAAHARPDEPASLESLVEAAGAKAFEAGRAQGYEEALATLEASRTEQLGRLSASLAQAAARAAEMRSSVIAEVEADVVGLVLEVAEAVIGHELTDRNAMRDVLGRALALVPRDPDLLVRLHPDCGLSAGEITEVARQHAAGPSVKVVYDDTIAPTGCVVAAGGCQVDAQVVAALSRVKEALTELFGERRTRPSAEGSR